MRKSEHTERLLRAAMECNGAAGTMHRLERENAELRSTLERVTVNFRTLLSRKPVRDAGETLAEAEALLARTAGDNDA